MGVIPALLAIGFVWSITPLSWLYFLWTTLTYIPQLRPGRPAPHHLAFKILHWLTFSYTCAEIVFSCYYRFLAIRANRRRPLPQYTRKYLRFVFKRSLENGLDLDEDDDEEAEQAETEILESLRGKKKKKISLSLKSRKRLAKIVKPVSMIDKVEKGEMIEMRQRTTTAGGDGACTPELGISHELGQPSNEKFSNEPVTKMIETMQTLNGARDQDDEGYGASIISRNSSTNSLHRSVSSRSHKPYTPSFITTSLQPDDLRAIDFRAHLCLWFHGCEYDEIFRDNMAEWLAWSCYAQHLSELRAERKKWEADGRPDFHLEGKLDSDEDGLAIEQDKLGLVEHCVDLVESRAAKPFPPGWNPKCKVIKLTLDPVRVTSRPLLLYGVVYALQKSLKTKAKLRGFQEMRDRETRYLYRIPKGWKPYRNCAEAHRPLLFIHGLGMGVVQYASLLDYLSSAPELKNRPIIFLIQPHISMSFFSADYLNPPNQRMFTAGIERMATKWKFDESGMTILSHSNGTICHGWILKDLPNLAVRSCFVDPVTFCLWEAHVCRNFLYSTPHAPIEFLMRYFVSRELGVAHMLQRTFDWSSNLLWPTEIPNLTSPYHSAFFLAGKDSILHADRIRKYLRRHGVKQVGHGENVGQGRGGLKVHADKAHGESMVGSGVAFGQIMSWVSAEKEQGAGPAGYEESSAPE